MSASSLVRLEGRSIRTMAMAMGKSRFLFGRGLSSSRRCASKERWASPQLAAGSWHRLQSTAARAMGESDQTAVGLILHNSMTRKKEPFRPMRDDGVVTMYVCGVTVYDYSHIGHARAYVSFDILYRFLEHLGYHVRYCRNFTDIDDKIIDRAAQVGRDPLDLSKEFAEEFNKDMDMLGCRRPTLEPLATQHIADMIDSISQIIENGHGYVVEGDVYFDVKSLPGYGRLSGRQLDDNRAGERVSVDERKKNPGDFALWKSAKPGEPTWESPWGPGRPGWHIECSSMIRAILGETIDIHGGGSDLLFPHHENELAQARATCCDQEHSSDPQFFARWWVHNGFVNVDSEKMSKSLGNFFTIRSVLESYHPLALRWFLVGTQYRQAIHYSQRALDEASDRLFYLYQTLYDATKAVDTDREEYPAEAEMIADIYAALGDDLNTPLVLAAFSPALKTLNDLVHTKKGKKRQDRIPVMAGILNAFDISLKLLGLHPAQQGKEFQDILTELKVSALQRAGMTEEDVQAAIDTRAEARVAKDYDAADSVRKGLESKGIYIMDSPQGTTWRPGCPSTEQ